MKLRLCIAVAGLVVAHGAAAKEPDPVKLGEVRSLVAEAWALDRAETRGRVTTAYAKALRHDLRDGLTKLGKQPELARVASEALAAMERRDEAALAGLRDRLVARERSHGRAG